MDVEIKFTINGAFPCCLLPPLLKCRIVSELLEDNTVVGKFSTAIKTKVILYLLGALPLSHYFIEIKRSR